MRFKFLFKIPLFKYFLLLRYRGRYYDSFTSSFPSNHHWNQPDISFTVFIFISVNKYLLATSVERTKSTLSKWKLLWHTFRFLLLVTNIPKNNSCVGIEHVKQITKHCIGTYFRLKTKKLPYLNFLLDLLISGSKIDSNINFKVNFLNWKIWIIEAK